MDYLFQDPRTFVMLVSLVLSAGGSIYAWQSNKSKARMDELAKIDARVDIVERNVRDHELAIENLPNKDALHELQMSMERMNGTVGVIGETLKGVKETSNLLRDWLVKESGK